MLNKTEIIEKEYLKNLLKKVELAISFINERIQYQSDEIKYLNNHLSEHKRDMDHLEKNAMRESITNTAAIGDHSVEKKRRLLRLKNVPYFGRIDFRKNGNGKSEPFYVGVHNFFDEDSNRNLVYDWRAPISSMFYDFELGEAFYETKKSRIEGTIDSKRQFRIRNGEMEYMLDSDITIQDDVLQKELNQATSGKMRNIVATIQREQNTIIRSNLFHAGFLNRLFADKTEDDDKKK